MTDASRAEVCAVAIADTFAGDGEILVSPIGLLPQIGARLAKATSAPDLLMTDGVAPLVANVLPVSGEDRPAPVVEGWLPYRKVFELLWWGRRHVMMGATQIDRFGNQNIACIGPHEKPKAMLLGMRGAPGNTISHPTSYWVPNHSTKTFVPKVDVVSGFGYDRAAALGPVTARFHDVRRVVSNLGVFDFATPDHSMRLVSLHPGVTREEVVASTGFPLAIAADVATTREPSREELRWLREVIDPESARDSEVRA
ncbi:MAG TPA: CoA-transferase [Myxococcota bacterium]|nr:CoA-transferase [Myxococcota bacterium]